MPQFLVTVAPREPAPRGEMVHMLYLLAGPALGDETVAYLTAALLHDPVVQTARWTRLDRPSLAAEAPPEAAWVLEIAYRPGVTDNEGEMVLEGARRLEAPGLTLARALRRYLLPPHTDPVARAAELANDLVQTTFTYAPGARLDERLAFYATLATVPEEGRPVVASVPLREADDTALLRISQEGVLALDLDEMRAIRAYFTALGRDPTDGELETLAQTWSEHCSHKSFKARVLYRSASGAAADLPDATLHPMLHRLERGPVEIDSLIRTFLMAATREALARRHGRPASDQAPLTDDWVLSAFVDNAGIIAFDQDYEVSFKVETHNHPSALEPFGGANTGVGGVIRDVLGVSAEPIANTDVLCFGMPDTPATGLPAGVLHPARVASGVVAGVRDYGNKLGIPTVNGAVLFDPGYTANPLVY
ncbi:MAG: AIR synthase related protein, partial [Chloroflexaceae bacterium]|nr:AIR synthase related protein [Chloroflexaceae bacterium]